MRALSRCSRLMRAFAVTPLEQGSHLVCCRWCLLRLLLLARLPLVHVRERLPVGVAGDVAILAQLHVRLIDGPRRREALAFSHAGEKRRQCLDGSLISYKN